MAAALMAHAVFLHVEADAVDLAAVAPGPVIQADRMAAAVVAVCKADSV
jgi:hypothetical protein